MNSRHALSSKQYFPSIRYWLNRLVVWFGMLSEFIPPMSVTFILANEIRLYKKVHTKSAFPFISFIIYASAVEELVSL